MATTPRARPMTLEELESRGDERVDLLWGELVETPPANFEQGKLTGRVIVRLGALALGQDMGEVLSGETGYILRRDPDVVLAPDAAFVREDRVPPASEQRGFASVIPDLVVEVVSPSDNAARVNDKVMLYPDAGVRMVVVIDPQSRTLTVYGPDRLARILRAGETLDGGDVLPGFQLPISELFA